MSDRAEKLAEEIGAGLEQWLEVAGQSAAEIKGDVADLLAEVSPLIEGLMIRAAAGEAIAKDSMAVLFDAVVSRAGRAANKFFNANRDAAAAIVVATIRGGLAVISSVAA